MSDHIKQRLDKDWHAFLDSLNETYEDAYRATRRAGDQIGLVKRIHLVLVCWREDEPLEVGLGTVIKRQGEDDAAE